MRSAQYIYATVLTFALAGTAAAQTAQTAPPRPTPAPTQSTYGSSTDSHWLASGFVGGGWNTTSDSPRIDTNGTGVNFGGQIAYLWRGYVGPEFLANWTPSFDVTTALVDGSPHVANYMANAIGVARFGADGQFQPYVSGGFGRTAIGADFVDVNGSSRKGGWGSNIGGGVMAFANSFGVRGDIRYYHANTINDFSGTADEQIIQSVLSGLAYWQASGGISFRW
jgi:hypothetical protein